MTKPVSAPDARSMHATFVSLFNAGDLDALVELYEPDAVLNATPGAPVSGKDAIRGALQGFLALGGKISINTLDAVERPDGIALTYGEWSVKGGSTEMGGKSVEVLRRQPDGRWLYIIDNPAL